MSMRSLSIAIALLLVGGSLHAQSSKLPGADEVKGLQAKYREERDQLVKDGVAKRVLPAVMDKAEELAKKSEVALAGGRTLQAVEAIRQARWQLPYVPSSMPDNVSRIIGNLRLRHMRDIYVAAFSPDGLKLATASADGTVKIWDLGNGHEILTYAGHTDKVRCLAWSPDGKTIASAGMEKNIKIWDSKTGKEVHSIPAVGDFVSAIAIARNGKHVFTGQLNVPGNPPNGLFVYDTATGKLVREVRDFTNRIGTIAINPEGNIIAAGDDNGNTRLWQYPSMVDNVNQPAYWTQQDATGSTYHLTFHPDGKTLLRTGPIDLKFYTTPEPGAPFAVAMPIRKIQTLGQRSAAFSKDGKTVFAGGSDANIYLWEWDQATPQLLSTFKNAHSNPINSLVFNSEGSQLASCAGDFTVRLWDFDIVLQSRDFEGHDGPVWTAAFSPDGKTIISASADKTARVWQRDSGRVLFSLEHSAPVTIAQFSPDGKLIASAGGDKILRIWDADKGKPLHVGEGHQGTITFLDFSPDSKRIVSGGVDRLIKIWNADTCKELVTIADNPSVIAGVAFSPDAHMKGGQIAVANIDQTIRLYDAATGKMQASWNAHGTSVNCVAYSPNGQFLASGGSDAAVQVWPLATPGTNSIRLTGHTGPISMVAFRKDSQHLVSCGADRLIKLWKLEGNTGKEAQTFRGHQDWVTAVAFSKDGYHVVSSSVDRRMKIWEITSREIPLLAEHTSMVEAVACSPDGKLIATGSLDRTIKLWDRQTGVEVATLTGHDAGILSLVFTPDSKQLISSDRASAIRLWEVNPPREIVRTARQLAAFKRLLHRSPYIALDPTGKTLLVWMPVNETSHSTLVEAYDIASGNQFFRFVEDSRKVNSLSFCANGQLAATGAKDGSVRLWQMGKNSANVAPGGDWSLFPKVDVADLALTPDGATLIVTSGKGEIKIGNVAKREVLKTFNGHEGSVGACVVSPDGKRFATVGADNLIKVWDLEGKELRRWDFGKAQSGVVLNLTFSADGRQLVTANANTTVYVLDLP